MRSQSKNRLFCKRSACKGGKPQHRRRLKALLSQAIEDLPRTTAAERKPARSRRADKRRPWVSLDYGSDFGRDAFRGCGDVHCTSDGIKLVRTAGSVATAEGKTAGVSQTRFDDGVLDQLPLRERMRAHQFDHGGRNWGHGPLRRILHQNVGSDWATLRQMLLDAYGSSRVAEREELTRVLDWLVVEQVTIVDGVAIDVLHHFPVYQPQKRFYVDEQGKLRSLPRSRSRAGESVEPVLDQRIISPTERLIKLGGIWFSVEFQPITLKRLPDCIYVDVDGSFYTSKLPVDIILHQEAVDDPSLPCTTAPFERTWGSKVYASRKLQLCKRELRRHGLHNN